MKDNIDYISNFLNESISVREATRKEFDLAFDKVVQNEIDMYYKDVSDEEIEVAYNELMGDRENVWSMKNHAFTTDGTDCLVLTPNKDGSNYGYLWYIDPEKRNYSAALALFLKAVESSPKGLSFHTNKSNKLARVAIRYGFKAYPSSHPNEIFMSNVEGIDGNEWWEDSEISEN